MEEDEKDPPVLHLTLGPFEKQATVTSSSSYPPHFLYNCSFLSHLSASDINNIIHNLPSSITDSIASLCGLTQEPSPYNLTTPATIPPGSVTLSPPGDEGNQAAMIGLTVTICCVVIAVFTILIVIVIIRKKRLREELGLVDSELGREDDWGAENAYRYQKNNNNLDQLRGPHRDGTVRRANGLPTIRMYIRAHRPIMLQALQENKEEEEERCRMEEDGWKNCEGCRYEDWLRTYLSTTSAVQVLSQQNGQDDEKGYCSSTDLDQTVPGTRYAAVTAAESKSAVVTVAEIRSAAVTSEEPRSAGEYEELTLRM